MLTIDKQANYDGNYIVRVNNHQSSAVGMIRPNYSFGWNGSLFADAYIFNGDEPKEVLEQLQARYAAK